MTYIAKPKLHHPSLAQNGGLTHFFCENMRV